MPKITSSNQPKPDPHVSSIILQKGEHWKAVRRGRQGRLGLTIGVSRQAFCDIVCGRKNAGIARADRLAALTGTDIRVWLQGGSPEARRAAVESWEPELSGN